MLTKRQLWEVMPWLEQYMRVLIVPTMEVPVTPNPLGQVFPLVKERMDGYLDTIRRYADGVIPFIHAPQLEDIPEEKVDETTPHWDNPYFSGGDAKMAYAVVARHRPRLIVEIGSGHSTRFMRRAATDYDTGSRIVCIDPNPRAAVGEVADEFIQASATTVDLAVFERLAPGDVLFIDSSHLVMNGSDCTHLFLNVLPRLPRGIWVHWHDVFLPYDYPHQLFVDCKSNEQYLVANLILSSREWVPVLPVYYGHLLGILPHGGGSFWMRRF